jgi:hypothetical protein
MDCLQRCITPREKTKNDNNIKNTDAETDTYTDTDSLPTNYFTSYTSSRGSRSYDDLQRIKREYYSKRSSNPNPIIMDHDNFLFSHCYSNCMGCYYDSTYNWCCYDKYTKHDIKHDKQKYADDGSFLMFHIKVLFCLE